MKLPVIVFILLSAVPLFANNGGENFMNNDIPTIAFCEMVKNPKLYFDKTIRITAIFTQADEAQYLSDKDCELTHDEQIGISYINENESERLLKNEYINKIGSPEYGSKAIVTAVGMLRNQLRRDFAWYHHRFDITRFENISNIIVPYQGELEGTITYRAKVYYDKNLGLVLANPVRTPLHYATHFEWTNLKHFSDLKKAENKETAKTIVFSVLLKEIKQMTENRWNISYECKIIRVE